MLGPKENHVTEPKKKFHVVGIPYNKNVAVYAKKLEAEMNRMTEEGYSIQITDQKTGAIIIGQLVEMAKHPLHMMLEARERAQAAQEPDEKFSPPTKALLARVARLPGNGQSIEQLTDELTKNASAITRGIPAEDLTIAAKELEAAAEMHAKADNHDDECTYDKALLAVAASVRSILQTTLQ